MHTIEKFRMFEQSIEIILVLPVNQLSLWDELINKHSFKVTHKVITGGSTRFESVKNGLQAIRSEGFVAIHDGVRPLVSRETIGRCFAEAEKYGNAVPVITPADSLRLITAEGNIPLNRQFIRIIQTPQVFDSEAIKKAYCQKYRPEFTDDATLLERNGETIHLVEGNRENIKITTPEDLVIARVLLKSAF
jgi:2-C-methyl-D-erythritol 4-phosphate cytidylyltransferase